MNDDQMIAVAWIIKKMIKLTGQPVPGYPGLPVVLAAVVAYRCEILGPPAYIVAQRWTGLPFSPAILLRRVVAVELLSDVAILELTRQLLQSLDWVTAAVQAAMWQNPTHLTTLLFGSVVSLGVAFLQASAYIMYAMAMFELFKALDRVLPDAARHAAFIGFFCGCVYCHLFAE
ncbi:hypothetical protein F4776DRAFT_667190 [Hypoxylon sp. NC0597]|nr:hypothetical protein F4776DRAFT_667190 [Hypoxylon sp. NC0597]